MISTRPFEWLTSLPEYQAAPRAQRFKLVGAYLVYAFAVMTSDEIHPVMKSLGLPSLKLTHLRRSLRHNGALLRDVKVFAYALWHERTHRSLHSKWVLDDVRPHIHEDDRKLIRDVMREVPGVNTALKHLHSRGCPLMGIPAINQVYSQVFKSPDVKTYTGRFIGRKMRWLLDRQYTEQMLRDDMYESAYFNLMRVWPNWQSLGHCIATAKTAIHNRGVNIMQSESTQSRVTMRKLDNGSFEATVVVSTNIEAVAGALGVAVPHARLDGSASSDGSTDPDDIGALRAAVKDLPQRQKDFIDLLMGVPHDAFSLFLNAPNEQAIAEMEYDKYLNAAATFCGMATADVSVLLGQIRKSL